MKLLYFTFTFIVCLLASLVNASDVPSFRVQEASSSFEDVNEQTTDSNTPCSFNPAKNIRLLTSDNEEFVLQKELAERSAFIKNILEDVNQIDPIISLPNITATTLRKVIVWCEHHSSDPINIDENERYTIDIDEWDQNFLEVDQETLFDIVLAAYYLDIKLLLDIGCKTVANMIKGKSAEEIRTIFNITNDFTPEEEAQIRKENEWIEDRESETVNLGILQ